MKTIEQRAVDAFPFRTYAPAGCGALLEEQKKLRSGYVRGATEQRKIDIEKACEWWGSRCDNLGISRYQIELFKKAMEGGEE